MKNTFKINSISITIDGNPVEINGFEISNEISTQELAAQGGLIKGIMNSVMPFVEKVTTSTMAPIKESFKEPVQAPVKEPMTTSFKEVEETTEKCITTLFDSVEKPEALKPDGFRTWKWEDESSHEYVEVIANNFNSIRVKVWSQNVLASIYVKPGEIRVYNISKELIPEFLKASSIPGDIQEYILKVVNL